jgi:hypothetical protein
MKDLIKKVEKLEDDVERLSSLQSSTGGGGGGVTSVSGTAPIASSGGTTPAISLGNSGIAANTYTNPTVTFDAHGLATSASSGTAPVTSVGGTSPIVSSGGTTPSISLGNSGVTPGTYLGADITVDIHGLVTSAANGSGGTGTDSNLVVLTNGSGSTIAQYALVGYLSAGNITLANSTTGSDIPAIGIALSAITAGATGQVRTGGILAGLSSLTSGALYFSNPSTPGTFTNSPGSVGSTKSQYIGRALSTTTLLIEIAEPILVAAATGTIVIKRNPSTGRIEETNVASLQSAYPGTADTGNVHVNGTVGADTRINLSTVPMLERGGTFPTSGLVDGQSYFHTTYRAWFIYNLTDTKWRQEAPGVFASSFPTVASGDNTVAPQITVKRLDRNNTNWYWDGTRWLSEQVFKMPLISRSSQPFPQAVTVFDLHLVDFATYGGIYLSKIGSGVFFSAAQNATNFYTMSASIFDTSGASTAITLTGTTDTKTYTTAGSFRPMVPTITPTAYGNTNMLLVVIMTPTLNPGTFFQNISAQFQLIG